MGQFLRALKNGSRDQKAARYFNPGAFAPPASNNAFGTLRRNALNGPSTWGANLALLKKVRLTEHHHQFERLWQDTDEIRKSRDPVGGAIYILKLQGDCYDLLRFGDDTFQVIPTLETFGV